MSRFVKQLDFKDRLALIGEPVFLYSENNAVYRGQISGKQKPAKINVSAGFSGAPRRIRIPSLLIRSQMLYPVELWALKQERIYAHRTADASFFFKKFAFLIKILAKAQDVGTFNRYPHFKTKRKKKIAQFSYS